MILNSKLKKEPRHMCRTRVMRQVNTMQVKKSIILKKKKKIYDKEFRGLSIKRVWS